MKPEILKPMIRCDKCKTLLENGDPGGKVEFRRCYECVIKYSKGVDKRKVLLPEGFNKEEQPKPFEESVSDMTKKINAGTPKPDRFVFEYQLVEANELNPEPRLLWLIRYETYDKRLIAELGLPRIQLEEIVDDMKKYEDEIKMDIAEKNLKEEP